MIYTSTSVVWIGCVYFPFSSSYHRDIRILSRVAKVMINGETLALLCPAVDTRRGSRDNSEAARIIKQSEHPSWATATTFSRLIRCLYFIWYCGAWKHLGCRNTYVIKQVMWLVLVHFVIWNGNRKHGDCSSHAAVWHQHHREPRPGWHQNKSLWYDVNNFRV